MGSDRGCRGRGGETISELELGRGGGGSFLGVTDGFIVFPKSDLCCCFCSFSTISFIFIKLDISVLHLHELHPSPRLSPLKDVHVSNFEFLVFLVRNANHTVARQTRKVFPPNSDFLKRFKHKWYTEDWPLPLTP